MLELKSVDAGYGTFQALFGVNLEVKAGEAVGVIGPNGAGKTTLMRVISGLIRPRAGAISMEGVDILKTPEHRIVSLGGEQQMCAIGRALMSDPKLLLLDEPSAGLAPVVVQQVFELVKRIRASGLTVLIVEQNVQQVLRVVDRAYLLEAGTIRTSGSSNEMLADDQIRQAYLGV
jgi:branched-chain amino acid transport system ATP-binding protein